MEYPIQDKVLTKTLDGTSVSVTIHGQQSPQTKTLQGKVGVLALGKPGDIIETAYGPVVRSLPIVAADMTGGATEVKFGTYVAGKGILVNANDCAGEGTRFSTVTGLKAGQFGSFLVSGGCVVVGKNVQAIANAMVVQYLDDAYTKGASHTTDEAVYVIEVNGFDDDVDPSSSNG